MNYKEWTSPNGITYREITQREIDMIMNHINMNRRVFVHVGGPYRAT